MGSSNASGANRASEAIMKALDSPLLNDNKISGAKNVFLLIVSCSEEITIDELGEINDHIQTEAGGVANIIMGVGEDETLEDAISVTIIATGFDIDQQDEIVNTESKKVIHTLEDEQPAVQNLTAKSTAVVTPNILQKPVEDITPKKAEVIRHKLVDDTATLNLIPTTELIKNMSVIYEEVTAPIAENDFIITSMTDEIRAIEVNDPQFVISETKEEEEEENQIAFTFDMPLANPVAEETPKKEENIIKFELTPDDVNAMEVTDHVEVIPVTEVHDKGVTRYSLDDYMEEEATNEKNIPKVAEDGIVFEKKIITDSTEKAATVDEGNPFNATIEESLKSRVDERRRKLKEFNYKFNNNVNRIEEIEKQPAYKRAGIELDETNAADNTSRTSLGTDSNDDMQLRSNNSFLHDNVD
jgi:cell division protein FtsZ